MDLNVGYVVGKMAFHLKTDMYTAAKKRGVENVQAIQERVWKRHKYADAVVVCEGVRFDVHRSTLSAASSVFEAAFDSHMKEGQDAVYEIQASTPVVVEGFLQFLHTGSENVAEEGLVDLFDLAVQYDVNPLIAIVASKLCRNITVENVQVRARALKLYREKLWHCGRRSALHCRIAPLSNCSSLKGCLLRRG